MARPAGVHDASERQSQGVLFTGLLLFALSRTKKAPGVTQWIEHCLRALSRLCRCCPAQGSAGGPWKRALNGST